jgi:hypothetical protein
MPPPVVDADAKKPRRRCRGYLDDSERVSSAEMTAAEMPTAEVPTAEVPTSEMTASATPLDSTSAPLNTLGLHLL